MASGARLANGRGPSRPPSTQSVDLAGPSAVIVGRGQVSKSCWLSTESAEAPAKDFFELASVEFVTEQA
jgi:hypothetical protein